ncbi:MAG: toll/interleukin-1 receptor domain-containing protein [Acidobacteriaceae bacterium]|nr:toll/interleukin-1 receptor domain-containing protein [Acidobacteriaceae bacterium]
MAHDVFISYRHEDQEWADRIVQALESRGIPCWIASRDIPPGADWPAEIMDGLQSSRFVVFLLSSHSVNEEQISREIRIAADQLKIPIFPFRIEDVQPPKKIGYFLADIQWLDAFGARFDSAVVQLAQRIEAMRGKAATPGQSAMPAPHVTTTAAPTMPDMVPLAAPLTTIEKAPVGKAPLWIGLAVAALVVIGLIFYFATRSTTPRPEPQPAPTNAGTAPKEARDAAVKFVADLKSGDYEAAWNELTPQRREKEDHDKWISDHRAEAAKDGPFSADLNDCPVGPRGSGYVCGFTLHFAGGKTGRAMVDVVQKVDSGWGVASSLVRGPK